MKDALLQQLQSYFKENPVLAGKPAGEVEIRDAERRLRCSFAPAYVDFLRSFGCGVVGADAVFGVGAEVAPAMGSDDNVVTQTEHFRTQDWPGVQDWYVISIDGRGNPIGIDRTGRVPLSDHDAADITMVAATFEQFLATRLAR